MRTTYLTAAIIAIVIGVWLFSGQLNKPEKSASQTLAEQKQARDVQAEDDQPTLVRARVIQASQHLREVRVRGRTQNKRTVMVKAELTGRVIARPVERGDHVAKGALLCKLSLDDRQVGLDEARAGLQQAQIEYQGSLELKAKGFQSNTAIAQTRARLATAEAQVARRRLDLARTSVRAPFAGYVEDVSQEVGDYITPGTACATIVDLDPMLLVGRIAERDVQQAEVGKTAIGLLADGNRVEGTLSFVGSQSEASTRTYAIEVQVPNPTGELRSGTTTDIMIPVDEVLAHKISPALFALDDSGVVGVRTVNDNDRVEFYPVEVVANEPDGAIVTGLPTVTTLITVGQELVIPGERVEVSFEATGEMPASTPKAGATGDAVSGEAGAVESSADDSNTRLSSDRNSAVLAATPS